MKNWILVITPKISIVTSFYNNAPYIENCIKSVLNQNYPDLEYIIFDGGSTDDTVEIIEKYTDRLAFLSSEKDRGQTHALKKDLPVQPVIFSPGLMRLNSIFPKCCMKPVGALLSYLELDFFMVTG